MKTASCRDMCCYEGRTQDNYQISTAIW